MKQLILSAALIAASLATAGAQTAKTSGNPVFKDGTPTPREQS